MSQPCDHSFVCRLRRSQSYQIRSHFHTVIWQRKVIDCRPTHLLAVCGQQNHLDVSTLYERETTLSLSRGFTGKVAYREKKTIDFISIAKAKGLFNIRIGWIGPQHNLIGIENQIVMKKSRNNDRTIVETSLKNAMFVSLRRRINQMPLQIATRVRRRLNDKEPTWWWTDGTRSGWCLLSISSFDYVSHHSVTNVIIILSCPSRKKLQKSSKQTTKMGKTESVSVCFSNVEWNGAVELRYSRWQSRRGEFLF